MSKSMLLGLQGFICSRKHGAEKCPSLLSLFALNLGLFYSHNPYPHIIQGIKLFTFQPPSIPPFNQANGGNMLYIVLISLATMNRQPF